jgi:RimK family alpha-L-glutamate ligase
MWNVKIVVLHYPDVRRPNWTLLSEAAQRRGIHLATWEPHRLELYCVGSQIRAYYDSEQASPEIILHRTVSRFQGVVKPALEWWAAEGAKILNEPGAAYRSRDKLLTTISLCRAHVPIVPTLAFIEASEKNLRTVSGGQELILKPAHGVRGQGIRTFASAAELLGKWDPDRSMPSQPLPKEHYIAQPLVSGGGRDVRAFVVDGACVALMQRDARPGEVRANLALGAIPTRLPLTHPAASVAVAAMEACQLDYGGVDLIEDEEGAVRVLEVDAWAGFARITEVTGQDVAGTILDLATKYLPEGTSA